MKRLTVLNFLFLALGTVASGKSLETTEIFRQTRDAVVLLISADERGNPLGLGSGFFVGDGKMIATNFHVIEGAKTIQIKLGTGQTVTASGVARVDADHDLALLTSSSQHKPLELSTRSPDIGEEIATIGNPSGLEGTVSTGIVSGIRTWDDPTSLTVYQITAPISPGSSGGPVIDGNGKVLGVSCFYVSEGQNLNFAIPARYVQDLLSNRTLSKASTASRSPLRRAAPDGDLLVKVINGEAYSGQVVESVLNRTNRAIKDTWILVTFYDYTNTPTEKAKTGENRVKELKRLYHGYPPRRGDPENEEYIRAFVDSLDTTKTLADDPSHFTVIHVKDVVPPGLAVRFYHSTGASGAWIPKFRILDYSVLQDSSDGLDLFKSLEEK